MGGTGLWSFASTGPMGSYGPVPYADMRAEVLRRAGQNLEPSETVFLVVNGHPEGTCLGNLVRVLEAVLPKP